MESIDVFREVTPLSSEDCFVIMNRTKSSFTFPLHVHPEFELNFIENGKGAERIVGDSIETIDDLELCLIGNDKLEHGWMTANCQKEVRLSELADYVGMSEVSLSRFMKKRTGKNFVEYFNDLRLGIATRMLVNSNKTIAEITFEC